jgi:hypothetical protein
LTTVIFTWTVPYPTSTALPVKAPVTFLLVVVAGGATGVGFELAVALLVGFALCIGVLAALGAFVALGILVPGLTPTVEVDEICGGVIAKTAPRPPTVPPAINNERLIVSSPYSA